MRRLSAWVAVVLFLGAGCSSASYGELVGPCNVARDAFEAQEAMVEATLEAGRTSPDTSSDVWLKFQDAVSELSTDAASGPDDVFREAAADWNAAVEKWGAAAAQDPGSESELEARLQQLDAGNRVFDRCLEASVEGFDE